MNNDVSKTSYLAAVVAVVAAAGFPVSMLVGASLWDNKPWMITAIHAGDWLMKMVLVAVIMLTRERGSK